MGNFRTLVLTYFQSSMLLRIFDSFGGIRHNDIQFNAPKMSNFGPVSLYFLETRGLFNKPSCQGSDVLCLGFILISY